MVFAYLAAQNGRPVPRDELAELLWGDELPATWEKALRVLMTKLRAVLEEGGIDGSTALTSAFGCYKLTLPAGVWIDVDAAVEAVERGEAALAAGGLDEARSQATQAAALARRSFLPGEDGSWVEGKRRDLGEVLVRALECLRDVSLRAGDFAEAARRAEEVIELEPFRESSYRRLMEAHAAAGNPAEALRVYERCRRFLADELGAYPSLETESIYRELLDAPSSPPREAPSEAAPDALEREPRTPGRRRSLRPTAIQAAAGILALGAALLVVMVLARGASSGQTTVAANAVGLIDANGTRVRDQVAVDAAPTSVAFGHGAVWVTNGYANTVSRIDPRTRSVRQTITVGDSPSAIAVGGGAVWVANHDDGTVSWINPESNTVVKEIAVGNAPTALAFGYGSVWVTNATDRTVSRIDADTGEVVAPGIRTGADGRGIAVGAGSVWITDEATRTVVQLDPATNRVINKAPVGNGPAGIVYGEGTVWIANELDGTVSALDPRTLAIRAAIPVGGSPSALAFGEGGLWASVEYGGRLVKIDPARRDVSAVRDVGNRPKGLAVVPGGVWVAVQASGTGHRGGRLVVMGDDFDSIDPALAYSTDSATLWPLAYDALTAFRRVGGSDGTQLVADLAEALPLATDGGKSYTLRIRRGIRYSDGSLLRAQDFRRGLERMFVLGSFMLQGSALTKIVGASSCRPRRPCDLSRGVVVNGPNSLTVRLSAPDPRLLLALGSLVPVPRGTPLQAVRSRPIPSTGPYAIESYVPGRQLRLVRNRHFRSWSPHARPDGYPDEIAWRVDAPPDEAVRHVIDGRADLVLNTVPADRIAQLTARYPRLVHLIPQRATAFVFLNTRRPPFDDIRVRRAVNYAVDRKKMADLHGGPAVAEPTCQMVPPTVPGFRRYCPYTIDPGSSGAWKAPDLAKARELVAASGTKGERVVVWTFPYFAKEGRYFASLLRRLGYRAQLREFQEIGPYFGTLNRTPSVQAGFAGWFGAQLAADTLGALACTFGQNWAHFCDPRVDAQVKRLATEQADDPAGAAELAASLDRELVDRAPWVPIFTPRFADLTSKRVGNYQANTYASSTVLLDQLWVR